MTHKESMLTAKLEAMSYYIESKINTESVQYQQYRNLYIKGKISWTDFLLFIENSPHKDVINLRGNGSKTRIRDTEDLSQYMSASKKRK